MFVAHSRNAAGVQHELGEHLRTVAAEASRAAACFGGADLAHWVGLAHDLGKASDAFQAYLATCEREPHKRHPSTDHKGVGTLLAMGQDDDGFGDLAFLINGHHGGLPDKATLRTKIKELTADKIIRATTERLRQIDYLPPPPGDLDYPAFIKDERSQEFFLRMLFSALVDADHADTERHFEPPPLQNEQMSCIVNVYLVALALRGASANPTSTRREPSSFTDVHRPNWGRASQIRTESSEHSFFGGR